jgi:hypothetical protein
MMRTETALETSVFHGHLKRLIAREDFIECKNTAKLIYEKLYMDYAFTEVFVSN